ncbi:MAG: hypothetical protein WAX04_03885 [Oscillospiraceae bacterium]
MKIAMINGSPKKATSSSAALLNDLKTCFSSDVSFTDYHFTNSIITEKLILELSSFDAIVFAFPLYVDAIPSQLLTCLCEIEKVGITNKKIHIYAISNCGFYEGEQNIIALEILENWCEKVGLVWGHGIGLGCGGALPEMSAVPLGKGPKTSLGKTLRKMATNIENVMSEESNYISLDFPRYIYKFAAEMGWRKMIKANGLKVKDLANRL